ncbi:MAG: hypothetical protein J5944_10290, partial [Lentisphaeria bacterium]|nr:hypothetical protein [Lentisphaeria bacterium]
MREFDWTMHTGNEKEAADAKTERTESYEVTGTDHGILYVPAGEQNTKAKKKKKSAGSIAALCAACVILSGTCGFGGAALANRINGGGAAEPAAAAAQTVKSSVLSVSQVSAAVS